MPHTNLPQLQLPDPNGFVNALGAGMKLRRYQDEGDAAARAEEDAISQKNALSAYLAGDRSAESRRRLAATSPETVFAIEKNEGAAALNTARTATATAQGKKAELEAALQKLELGSQLLSGVHDEPTYQAAKAQAAELGLDLSQAPDRYFPDWVKQRQQQGLKVKDQIGLQLQALNVNSQIEERGARTDIAQGHLGVSQAGLGERERHNKVMEAKKPGGGLSITGYDAQGRPLIQVGGAAPLGKPAVNKLEENQIEGIEGLAQLDEINRVAKPKLLTYQAKAKDWGLDVLSKLGGELSPEQQTFRNEFTDMRQATMFNLNKTIKAQTGAAITAQEVPRIEATVPSMNDAGDQYMRKLENSQRLLRNGVIRAQIAREAGMDPLQSGIDLGDTKTLIDKRGEQLTRHITARSQGKTPAEVEALVDQQLKAEFGL